MSKKEIEQQLSALRKKLRKLEKCGPGAAFAATATNRRIRILLSQLEGM